MGRSAERSNFFKALIGELALPKGSSVFWPSAMPGSETEGDTALHAHPSIFSAGIQRLSPQLIIIFGETALADIGLAGRVLPFRQELIEGKLLVLLPEIEALLHNQKQRMSALSLLRAVLASVRISPVAPENRKAP